MGLRYRPYCGRAASKETEEEYRAIPISAQVVRLSQSKNVPNAANEVESTEACREVFDEVPAAMQLLERKSVLPYRDFAGS